MCLVFFILLETNDALISNKLNLNEIPLTGYVRCKEILFLIFVVVELNIVLINHKLQPFYFIS